MKEPAEVHLESPGFTADLLITPTVLQPGGLEIAFCSLLLSLTYQSGEASTGLCLQRHLDLCSDVHDALVSADRPRQSCDCCHRDPRLQGTLGKEILHTSWCLTRFLWWSNAVSVRGSGISHFPLSILPSSCSPPWLHMKIIWGAFLFITLSRLPSIDFDFNRLQWSPGYQL